MKSETAALILDYISDFVTTNPKDPLNVSRAQVLVDLLLSANIVCRLERDGEVSDEHAITLHNELTEYLESLSSGGEVGCYLEEGGVMMSASFSSSVSGPQLDLGGTGIKGFSFAMLYLCAVANVKGIFRCPPCGRYVFRMGRPKKFCSNRCKQRAYVSRQISKDDDVISQKR